MSEQQDTPRRARGDRPHFFDDPAVDQLYAMFLAMAGELSVAWDRIDTLERLLVSRGLLEAGDVAQFVPDESAAAERATRRKAMIERLLQVLTAEGASLAGAAEMPDLARKLAELSRR